MKTYIIGIVFKNVYLAFVVAVKDSLTGRITRSTVQSSSQSYYLYTVGTDSVSLRGGN